MDTLPWLGWLVVELTCLLCGHGQASVMPADADCRDRATGHIFGAECGACGEMACTSL